MSHPRCRSGRWSADVLEESLIGIGDPAVRGAHPDGLRIEIGEGAVPGLAGGQGLCGALLVVDIRGDAEPALDDSFCIGNGKSGHVEPAVLTIGGAKDSRLPRVFLSGSKRGDPLLGDGIAVFGVNGGEPLVLATRLRLGHADEVEKALVGEGDLAEGIAGEDELRVELGEDAIAIFAEPEGFRGVAVGGDIAEEDGWKLNSTSSQKLKGSG